MARSTKTSQLALARQVGLFAVDDTPNSFRKAVQVVHSKSRAPLSLIQRKLSNAWLKNAIENTPDESGFWSIRTAEMAQAIDFDSNNAEHLKNAARELMQIVFEWDVIAPASKRVGWKASVMFPDVELLPGLMRYRISEQIKKYILDPEMYALIDLNIVRKFRRASSLAIYEHCTRFVKIGHTASVPWREFRDMVLGVSPESSIYQEYKYFKAKVLNPSVAEINSQSDIVVLMHEIKAGRTVVALQFEVSKKQREASVVIEDEAAIPLVGQMVAFGVPQSEAKRLVREYRKEQIQAAVDYTKNRMADKRASKLGKPAAYFRRALQEGWGDAPPDAPVVSEISVPSGRVRRQSQGDQIREAYMESRIQDAEGYFNELDAADQAGLIGRYNDRQEIPSLRLKESKKPTKAVKAAFLQWLAADTWGDPTAEDLLEYAQRLLMKQAGTPVKAAAGT